MPDPLLTNLYDCVLAFDLREHKFLFISPGIASITGYPVTAFYQNVNLLKEITDPADNAIITAQTGKLPEGSPVELCYRIATANGSKKCIRERRSLFHDQHSGHNILLSEIKEGTHTAIDEQGMHNARFHELSFLFDNNPTPMLVYDVSSLQILLINRAAIDRYGYSEQEFMLMSIRDLHPPEDHKKFNNFIRQKRLFNSKQPGINYSGLWKHQNKNGDLIYAEISSQDVKFEEHDCRVAVFSDVTEKISYQEEAIWTKNSLDALINNTADLIWSVDKETRYVYMNKAYRDQVTYLTGIEPKEGDYSYLHKGYSPQEIEKWNQYYARALEGERYTVISESVDPLTQRVLSFEVSFNPIYKIKGDITGAGCFARNITEWLETEKAIIEQNERLRHIASLTSHELRRPVASMLGLINIMDRNNFFNPDNAEVIEHLLTVGNEIDEVIRLIIDKTFMDDSSKNKYQSP